MNFSRISHSSVVGKLIRFPLRFIPKTARMPILQGSARGLKWIVGSHDHGCWLGSYEYKKRKLFENHVKPGDCVYDIGAHAGYYSLIGSRCVGSTGCIYAFEPDESNLTFFKQHVTMNRVSNVSIIDAAVAATSGYAQFDRGNGSAVGKLFRSGETRVRTIALDEFILTQRPPHVLKIDIEGGELEALLGAKKILATYKPIIFLATHRMDLHRACSVFLQDYGYQLEMISNGEILAQKP